MIKFLLIIATLFISSSFAKVQGEKINRAELKKKLLANCIEISSGVADKKLAICKCIVTNFDSKSNDYELKVLTDSYDPKNNVDDGKEIQASALENFDFEVATECENNPNWKIEK